MSIRFWRGLAALALVAPAAVGASVAWAQAYQCSPPPRVPAPAAVTPDGPARRLPISGYTLALSWSPEFCRGRQRDRGERLQCGGGMGRFGFIVHGLWPQSARSWPQWCRSVPPPSATLVRAQLCRTPSPRLLGHEWAKHGSCMAGRASDYFKVSNIVADSLRYPDMERLSRDRALTAGGLRQALALANPGRAPASFGLLVSRGGWLREVRVCLDRRFRSTRCPARLAGPRDDAPLRIWRGL